MRGGEAPTSSPSLSSTKFTRAERGAAAALVLVGTFQLSLAAGAPWGRAAYGGYHPGVRPTRLRAVSSVAAAVYGTGAALILSGRGTPGARTRGFTILSAFMAVGALANGASRSPVERALWTPVTIAAAVCAWRSRSPDH